ncbi:MAG: cell division protein FtsZ, partial [Candidatus Hydrogenedentes bacterium]|nr:cell division protein FtsZ [Candidatus Hydrogenedentota bacterium]
MAAEEKFESFGKNAVIKVVGVGGGGGNAVNRMIEAKMKDVQFIVINTDAQDLEKSQAPVRLQIGQKALGAGARPEVGREACEGDRERVRELLAGGDLVFLTLGLGGGTGTGAAPIVAQEAADTGALTVAIVTLPFYYEGGERMSNALKGLEELEKYVDTLIVVPNDRIAELSSTGTSFVDAFRYGDEVLHNGVRAISELITVSGLINLDFSDVRTVMQSRGRALMGIGVAEGEGRAVRAAEEAVNCPLLEQSNIEGAKGVIVNVRGGRDVRMHEVQQANDYIRNNVNSDATIITGAVIDEDERPEFQVTVIAAGFPKKDVSVYLNAHKEADARKKVNVTLSPAGENKKKAPQGHQAGQQDKTGLPQPSGKPAAASKDGDLFDYDKKKPDDSPFITTSIDEPEDIGVPTFLRRRNKARK